MEVKEIIPPDVPDWSHDATLGYADSFTDLVVRLLGNSSAMAPPIVSAATR